MRASEEIRMYTGASKIRFSHSISEAVRESNTPRGEVSSSVDTNAQGLTSSRFSHALTPIGERNRTAEQEAWQDALDPDADDLRALAARIMRGGRALVMPSHLPAQSVMTRVHPPRWPTATQAIRRFCLECLGATTGKGAFDCGSQVCPLRSASAFLGRPMPESFRGPTYSGEPLPVPRRRPSRKLIHAQCRQCQPGDTTDCMAEHCALYPFRPWSGPGHAAKRKASPAQREAAARGRESMRQRASTAVGGAFDA